MAALTGTDVSLKGDGFRFNVRSMKWERTLDFAEFAPAASTEYEIGDFPEGFVPRAVAVVEIRMADASATLTVKRKSDGTALASRTLGAGAGCTCAAFANAAGAAETLALSVTAAPKSGVVKVVVAGDEMTGAWDGGLGRDASDPAGAVPDTEA